MANVGRWQAATVILALQQVIFRNHVLCVLATSTYHCQTCMHMQLQGTDKLEERVGAALLSWHWRLQNLVWFHIIHAWIVHVFRQLLTIIIITIIWLCRLNYIKFKVILLIFFQLRIMIMCTSSPTLMIETLTRMKQLLVQADSWSWIEEFCISRLKWL